jgi:hypothetical protein
MSRSRWVSGHRLLSRRSSHSIGNGTVVRRSGGGSAIHFPEPGEFHRADLDVHLGEDRSSFQASGVSGRQPEQRPPVSWRIGIGMEQGLWSRVRLPQGKPRDQGLIFRARRRGLRPGADWALLRSDPANRNPHTASFLLLASPPKTSVLPRFSPPRN